MPYYPLQCTFSTCGRPFEYFTKPDLYVRSRDDGFRDVQCTYCGSRGTMQRTYPPDSAPADITVRGTWHRGCSPELKGKSYYTKQERDRQLAEAGTCVVDDGDGEESTSSRSTKTYKIGKDGKIETVRRAGKKAEVDVIHDPRAMRPSDLIREFAKKSGGSFKFDDIVEYSGLERRKLNGGIMGAVRQGWLEKVNGDGRSYRLL